MPQAFRKREYTGSLGLVKEAPTERRGVPVNRAWSAHRSSSAREMWPGGCGVAGKPMSSARRGAAGSGVPQDPLDLGPGEARQSGTYLEHNVDPAMRLADFLIAPDEVAQALGDVALRRNDEAPVHHLRARFLMPDTSG
jgi:hypothetical protein